MVLIILPFKGYQVITHTKADDIHAVVDCSLVCEVSCFVNNITALLIVVSLIERYPLVASTDSMVTSSLFILKY